MKVTLRRHLSNWFSKTFTIFPNKSCKVVPTHSCLLRSGPWEKGTEEERGLGEDLERDNKSKQIFPFFETYRQPLI